MRRRFGSWKPHDNGDDDDMLVLPDFASIVGREQVQTSAAACDYFSSDIFFWAQRRATNAVIAPANVAEVIRVVRMAAEAGLAIVSRGGGMSYTGGYVPDRDNCVTLDLRRLNRILEINCEDQYVTVEAGSTWMAVSAALDGSGLRPMFRAPYSGIYSTVGGALSQGTPDDMAGILSLDVVLADGTAVRTGSAARANYPTPFFRNFGPDFTGLFIADGGTHGVKTAASIALEPKPRALGYASFAYQTLEAMMRAMVACAREKLPIRLMGLDPRKSQNAPRVGFKDAIEALAKVALTRPKLGAGMRDAFSMAAAGRNFMEGVRWSLHITAEGSSDSAVEAVLDILRQHTSREAREIPNLLPMALGAKPYSVRGFLGADGERWVPTNAMIPFSVAERAATQVQQYFESHRERMNALGMWESYMLAPRPGFVVLEPSFYWRDEVSALHIDHLDSVSAAKFAGHVANLPARVFANELRDGLKTLLDDLGAAHVQLAKSYAYRSVLSPEAQQLWQRVRHALDPHNIMNPGNLQR